MTMAKGWLLNTCHLSIFLIVTTVYISEGGAIPGEKMSTAVTELSERVLCTITMSMPVTILRIQDTRNGIRDHHSTLPVCNVM